jgi:hypothetical protein
MIIPATIAVTKPQAGLAPADTPNAKLKAGNCCYRKTCHKIFSYFFSLIIFKLFLKSW